jgi:hypothetical protein
MSHAVTLDPDDQMSVSLIWQYYETEQEAVAKLKTEIVSRILNNDPSVRDSPFGGRTLAEVDDYFNAVLEEVDHHVCLSLIAAVEAAVYLDFRKRVADRKKDLVSKSFMELFKVNDRDLRKISYLFDSDILQTWASQGRGCKKAIGEFLGAWNYRHWLAHGRYWDCDSSYHPATVMKIVQEMLSNMRIPL